MGLNSEGASLLAAFVAILAGSLALNIASVEKPEQRDPLIIHVQEREIFEKHLETYDEVEELVLPTHSCDSAHHDDFLEVASLAYTAGFPRSELHTAVAVAYAESLGDPDAVGHNRNGSKDTGLWQINSIHGFKNLKDPLENARAALEVWLAQGWQAWYAHTPRGGEYGSGERFIRWLSESQCSLEYYQKGLDYDSSFSRFIQEGS